MRNALVFAPIVLALGLATYWVASSGREPPASDTFVARDSRDAMAAVRAAPVTASPVNGGAPTGGRTPDSLERRAQPRAAERSAREDPSLALPRPEDTIEFSESSSTTTPLDSPEQRVGRLLEAGFTPERAAAIVQAEAKHRAAGAYEEYRRSGTVHALNASVPGSAARALRDEIGDDDYERYLAALGQPTRVVVGDVEPGSAAANAGLMAGDEIHLYRGRRVFNAGELAASALEGDIGQTVPTTIVRAGQELQLYLAGGDLGISPRGAN